MCRCKPSNGGIWAWITFRPSLHHFLRILRDRDCHRYPIATTTTPSPPPLPPPPPHTHIPPICPTFPSPRDHRKSHNPLPHKLFGGPNMAQLFSNAQMHRPSTTSARCSTFSIRRCNTSNIAGHSRRDYSNLIQCMWWRVNALHATATQTI